MFLCRLPIEITLAGRYNFNNLTGGWTLPSIAQKIARFFPR